MNPAIKKLLTGNTTCKLTNEKELKNSKLHIYTATISGVDEVYNLFPGRVVFLGFYEGMGTLSIQVSNHEVIRYLNLTSIDVWMLKEINKGDFLGKVNRRSGLQFEYCTQWKGESVCPVRFNNRLFYKQYPLDILNGIYTPKKEQDVEYGLIRPNDKRVLTSDQLKEFDGDGLDLPPKIELEKSPLWMDM